jgi:hypothetical protein
MIYGSKVMWCSLLISKSGGTKFSLRIPSVTSNFVFTDDFWVNSDSVFADDFWF